MTEKPVVYLTPEEMQQAAEVAAYRVRISTELKLKHAHNLNVSDAHAFDLNVCGAQGEMAVAKHFDLPWYEPQMHPDALKNRRSPDVGNFDVRTILKAHHKLILHPTDPPYRVAILVFNQAPRFQLMGWIWGKDGQQKNYWTEPQTGRPCYLIPQDALQPMNAIPPEVMES